MQRSKSFFWIIIVFLLAAAAISACSQGTSGSSGFYPTFAITNPTTQVTMIVTETEAFNSPTPNDTAEGIAPPIIVEQPTSNPTATSDITSVILKPPAASLNLTKPGPGSMISSPINVSGYTYPGFNNEVTLQLWGENGRLISNQVLKLELSTSGWVSFSTQIPFKINSGAESAWLELISYDGYGRRIALCNVPLFLMQIGKSEVESAGFDYQPYFLAQPKNNAAVSGGTLHVDGFAHPFNMNPVIIELIDENGTTLSTQIIPIKPISDANYMHFSGDITYSVSSATRVRMSIRQMMDHPPYLDLALSSITLTLQP